MNLDFHHLLPNDFHPLSRVWIYQANRQFTINEALQIEEMLSDFSASWLSHGEKVKGFANLFFGQFIIFMADESATGVSGCSTDGSVRLVKNLEKDFNVDLFNRQLLAFMLSERIQLFPLAQLQDVVDNELINPATIYFNNTVLTKKELLENWIIPVKDSWLGKRIAIKA